VYYKWYICYDIYNFTNDQTGIDLSPYALPAYAGEHRELHSNPDTDGDGIPDLGDTDSDNDGIKDGDEVLYWLDTDCDGNINMRDRDSDNDGLLDSDEDINCNGKLDAWESSPVAEDTDNDGLSDSQEWQRYFTNPANADTDGDGLGDAQEVNENVWWYRIENATKNLTVMPYSKYFLLYQANSTFVDFEIEGKTTRKIRKNAERGTWYYDFIATPEYPKKLIVHNNSITMLAFIPYEIGANWVQ
ncbi:MAG: hypothetical protein ACP5LE_08320, partial [Thermoplasmata archaeon]